MQGRENNPESRMSLLMGRLLMPNSGYESNTGGIMLNLRSLTAETVRQYHRDFYRSENLCLLVVGEVDTEALLQTLQSFDQKIVSKGPLPQHKRPWSHAVPPLPTSYSETVEFPTDDESIGSVYVAWRGPAVTDFETLSSLNILWKYLTESAISPLRQEFVENNPVCGSVDYSEYSYRETAWAVEFDDVHTKNLDEIRPRLMSLLEKISQDGVDMTRITDLINKSILEHLNQLEESPSDFFAGVVILDFLYADTNEQMSESLQVTKRLEAMKSTDSKYWTGLLEKYFLKANYVEIKGKPSAALSKQMADDEKQRIQKQKELLGEEGLKQKALALEQASLANNRPMPENLIDEFPVPDPAKVPLLSVSTHRFEPFQPDTSDASLPFFVQFDTINTKFVDVALYIDTSNIADTLRPYLELYLDVMFELPILREGVLIPYEKVISQLEAETVDYANSVGLSSSSSFSCGLFSQLLSLRIKSVEGSYANTIRWLYEILMQTQFTEERVKVSITKMLSEAISSKRNGSSMSRSALRYLLFDNEKSNQNAVNVLNQLPFLQGLKNKMDEKPTEIIEKLIELRSALLQPFTVYGHVACSERIAQQGLAPWVSFFGTNSPAKLTITHKETIPSTYSLLTEKALTGSKGKATVFPLPAIESGFLVKAATGPQGFDNQDALPLRVLIEYLTNLEGPMWKEIRGLGLAYSYGSYVSSEDGLIYFNLYRASHVLQAYSQAKKIVMEFAEGKRVLNKTEIGGAKSSVIFEILSQQETVGQAARYSMVNYFRKLPQNHDRELLARIKNIGAEDLLLSLKSFYLRLFDESTSVLAFCVNPSSVEKINEGFEADHNLQVEEHPAVKQMKVKKQSKKSKVESKQDESEDEGSSEEGGSGDDSDDGEGDDDGDDESDEDDGEDEDDGDEDDE
eukprot:TRINITY_DN6211_c0_g2_i2.p1 TRINITY_DN6211_c0_g2~~TRINITY_DN6211_c0_g2_i2.p1  ORF type:complete len:914 (-),score=188.85 TRINITY_DN6211_c0_g2_i2:270-3011(-)